MRHIFGPSSAVVVALVTLLVGCRSKVAANSDGSGISDGGASCQGANCVTAVSADAFLSSLGVNTHLDQGYGGMNGKDYVGPLKYLGVRTIRDGGRNLTGAIAVHQQTGVLVNVGKGCDLTNLITAAKTLDAAGALLSIEGPNEPNNFAITYNGQMGGGPNSWVPVAQCQRDLYQMVKNDPVLKKYPVFHVSEGGAERDNVGMQFLTIPAGAGTLMPDGTQYADYANPHNYVIGNGNMYSDNQAWSAADQTLRARWDGLSAEYGKTWFGRFSGNSDAQLQALPRVTTETGWDSINNPGGEHVQAVVLVNTYLAQFKRGWRYTFIYELVDNQGSSTPQGLYRADYTAKLSADYIHNLTTVLADGSPLANPGQLDYSIPSEPPTVHDLLIQKSSGEFELVVWDERVSATDAVTVEFGSPHGTVHIYDTTSGTTPINTLTNISSVPLSLSDHALILEVK